MHRVWNAMFGRIFGHVWWSIFLGGWKWGFWKVNSIRFKGFRVSIVMAHEKFPTFASETRLYFLFLDFWKCQCTLLGVLTCELDFIIINKNDHFIQIVYWFWDYSNFVTTHLNASGDDFILLLSKQIFDDCLHVGLVQSKPFYLVSLKPQMWILFIKFSLKHMLVLTITLHHCWGVGLIVLVHPI